MLTGYVSNGNGTPEVLEYIRPWVDLYKVDLKSFDDRHYRQLGGRLQPILDTIRRLHAMGFWVEIVTLLIPGFNDSPDEIARLTEFVAGVSPDIPWHVTAFHRRLQDDGSGEHDGRHAARRRRDRTGRRAALRVRRQPAGRGRGSGEHALRRPAARRSSRATGTSSATTASRRTAAAPPARNRFPADGDSDSTGKSRRGPSCPDRARGCPSCHNRGQMPLLDTFKRPLRNLRLSVTDRCNLRCEYCMPESEYVWLPREDVLHFEEIEAVVDVFLALGVDRLRLTGGEPLLRRDLASLVRMLSAKPGLADLAMTSNGVLLADHIDALAAAGLGRVTVSLDTLRPDRFTALTRVDDLPRVKEGIEAAHRVFGA